MRAKRPRSTLAKRASLPFSLISRWIAAERVAACLPLFHERRIAVLGSDTGNDVMPSGYPALTNPIHQVGIVAMGMWILDNPNLEQLAAACKERNRWEFMLSIGPLRLHNTTGSPVNPIAVF